MALASWRGSAPFAGLLELQDALARTLESPGFGLGLGAPRSSVFPPINVFMDKEGSLLVRAELPGIAPDEVQIQIEPQLLTIAGERTPDAKGNGYHRRERRFGRFSRSVQIPADLDPERASASYHDGLLSIRIPRSEAARPRKVAIQSR